MKFSQVGKVSTLQKFSLLLFYFALFSFVSLLLSQVFILYLHQSGRISFDFSNTTSMQGVNFVLKANA